MTIDRNADMPRGPHAKALGTLLSHLYKDIIDREVRFKHDISDTIEVVVFHNWRGLHSVSITRGQNHSLWVTFSDGHQCVSAAVGVVPEWLADRIRMIWVECNSHDPAAVLFQVEEG